MAQDRRQPLDRLLPPEGGTPPRTVLLSFGLWPLAVLLLVHGMGLGLASLSMFLLPVCLVAFRRVADLFPRRTPARRVIVVFSAVYAVVVFWSVLAHPGVLGVAVAAVVAGCSVRALLRPGDEGVPALEAMSDLARMEWEMDRALSSGGSDPSGPDDDSGLGPMPRFHWPDG
jgi:hypothetical protein